MHSTRDLAICSASASDAAVTSTTPKLTAITILDPISTDLILPITNYQCPMPNYQLPITNYQLPITNYPFLTSVTSQELTLQAPAKEK
ncbi:MAG: hypothetical protein EAZ60_15390 [Oscillatoriales cyanobacterium]|nr:MAG: hypothetical protein EAZ79_08830 [Oscillatoriales cyanobacterium]TAF15958.1 MAG: hypothetical protein EAZ73_25820 [Oscillatoriales cyanobacterium]TAF54787.1 MAG: hypothetical protein EAZ60_15390 [Oscillatoriales cyanobacterium]